MASSGYMTELDTESIWDTAITTARFDLINVRMGEILNVFVRKDMDSQTDITDAKILPILEQMSEEALMELIQASKGLTTIVPWDFIQANVMRVMSKVFQANIDIINLLKVQQETKLHIKYSNKLRLTSHSD